MRISLITKLILVLLVGGMGAYLYNNQRAESKKINSVYIVPTWDKITEVKFAEKNIDVAFIAFAQIDKNRVYFHEDKAVDGEIKENIKTLKKNNPQTRLVLAIGGYGAGGFSDASLGENRREFTDNIIALLKELNLDGIDIDWEYPASDAWGTQKSRPEDTQNFTLLMKELREKMNLLPHKKKKYILSFASGTQDWYFKNVEVETVQKYVDYINLMSYDLTGKWSDTTGYNSNLYADADNKSVTSVDKIISMYLEHHIDPQKILLGVPAYSYGWKDVKSEGDGSFSPGTPIEINKVDLSYKALEEDYFDKNNFKRYYDEQAKAAYLFDGETFISYEDKEALKEKIAYIKAKNLGGAMVWEYSQDSEDGIMKYLGDHLNE
ncbi:glycoside hydrolase family 18 protein [Paenibacillus sp. FJAT-26967]|uniref:glycoside hydrolase family 18 protein n=1 Tax=Paenibacillus sp. FJAT-26967 TaxID=1729690 RepID=UPI000838A1A9|nr:glycosyl hydrolase family 18 protein [Paenibacillus sp. FJAT-26967]